MTDSFLIKNATLINEGKICTGDVFISNERIEKIETNTSISPKKKVTVIDAKGKSLIPGVIDDQVHFRDPGLTYKADIYSESKAAVAGGITSYMEMPNTIPNTLTQELLEEKYRLGSQKSLANYSFFIGAANNNLEEVLKTDPRTVCGVKIFMGSSTGNMLVDDIQILEKIFATSPVLIATHCEDETTIRANTEKYKAEYGEDIPVKYHPEIRNEEACYKSSRRAVELAEKHGTRLHILHISTVKETGLFRNDIPLEKKKITAEVCIHHLWFDDKDYGRLGTLIKWNPAIKTKKDKEGLLKALLENKIDIIATDHAPHTLQEKKNSYFKAPAGGPLIQHSLVAMLDIFHQGRISLEKIVEKMCHAPAVCYQVKQRGFIREGYYADLALIDLNALWTVNPSNILSKCAWSPFEGQNFKSQVTHTFVNGKLVYINGKFDESVKGQRLLFER